MQSPNGNSQPHPEPSTASVDISRSKLDNPSGMVNLHATHQYSDLPGPEERLDNRMSSERVQKYSKKINDNFE
jgi:hypothetical protein